MGLQRQDTITEEWKKKNKVVGTVAEFTPIVGGVMDIEKGATLAFRDGKVASAIGYGLLGLGSIALDLGTFGLGSAVVKGGIKLATKAAVKETSEKIAEKVIKESAKSGATKSLEAGGKEVTISASEALARAGTGKVSKSALKREIAAAAEESMVNSVKEGAKKGGKHAREVTEEVRKAGEEAARQRYIDLQKGGLAVFERGKNSAKALYGSPETVVERLYAGIRKGAAEEAAKKKGAELTGEETARVVAREVEKLRAKISFVEQKYNFKPGELMKSLPKIEGGKIPVPEGAKLSIKQPLEVAEEAGKEAAFLIRRGASVESMVGKRTAAAAPAVEEAAGKGAKETIKDAVKEGVKEGAEAGKGMVRKVKDRIKTSLRPAKEGEGAKEAFAWTKSWERTMMERGMPDWAAKVGARMTLGVAELPFAGLRYVGGKTGGGFMAKAGDWYERGMARAGLEFIPTYTRPLYYLKGAGKMPSVPIMSLVAKSDTGGGAMEIGTGLAGSAALAPVRWVAGGAKEGATFVKEKAQSAYGKVEGLVSGKEEAAPVQEARPQPAQMEQQRETEGKPNAGPMATGGPALAATARNIDAVINAIRNVDPNYANSLAKSVDRNSEADYGAMMEEINRMNAGKRKTIRDALNLAKRPDLAARVSE